jgi:hypothetical protein
MSESATPETFVTQAEFYAEDRFHAVTHALSLLLPAEVKTALVAALETLAHSGPVHVELAPGDDALFAVHPITFVKV